jgi:hypothetical protein
MSASAAQITPSLFDQAMTLGREREVAVSTRAAVDVTGDVAAFDRVGVAAIGRQLVHPAHDQLPFFAMGLDALAKQLVGDQVRDFVGHGLFEKIFAVFPVQLRIETQQIFVQMRDASFLATQLEADYGAFERSFEKGFSLLETVFDAGIELLGHAVRISRGVEYAAIFVHSESVRRRMVTHPLEGRLAAACVGRFCLL